MELSIHLHKKGVETAVALLKAATLRKSRRRYKREVLSYTKFFNYKIRSFKSAEKSFLKSETAAWKVVLTDGKPPRYYFSREYEILKIEKMVNNDVRDVIEVTPYQLDCLKPYMKSSTNA